MRRPTGCFWPTPAQELLLTVALADPPQAAAAWRELRPRLDLDHLERGSFTLLPLVYRALSEAAVHDSLLPRLKGIYRNTWTKGSLLLERARAASEALAAAGVPALLLGGVGSAVRYYGDVGLRPTVSVDLLVEPRAAPVASRILAGAGLEGPAIARAQLATFDHERGPYVLTTSIARDFVLRGDPQRAHAALRDAARSLDVRGTHVPVLAPGDELLAACVTGARSAPAPNVQWIADAATILRTSSNEIDWDRLVRLGREWGRTLRLRDSLEYLGRLPGVEVPAETVSLLEASPPTRRERLAHAWAAGSLNALGRLPETLGEHLLATADRPLSEALAGFARVLRERWGVRHGWQLPLAGGRRAGRMLLGGRSRSI